MVLVLYTGQQFTAARDHDDCRKIDVEASSEKNQHHLRISNETVQRESGYMEICKRILRQIVVEDRAYHGCPNDINFHTVYT